MSVRNYDKGNSVDDSTLIINHSTLSLIHLAECAHSQTSSDVRAIHLAFHGPIRDFVYGPTREIKKCCSEDIGPRWTVPSTFSRRELQFSNTDLYRTQTQGMSGRALRRLPVLALARYIGIGYTVSPRNITSTANGARKSNAGADVDVWLDGMEGVVREQAKEQERLK